jgi:hypothetical protein
VFDWSPVKVALLDLGSCCIATPWNDGGASNLLGVLAQTSRSFSSDNDVDVSTAAKAALRVCDSAYVPRAPALLFVSRAATDNSVNAETTQMSAEAAMKKMKVASVEAERTAKLSQEVEKAKRQKLEEKRLKEQEAKEEKAKKRRKIMETVESSKEAIAQAMKVDKKEKQATSSSGTSAAKGSSDKGTAKHHPKSEPEHEEMENEKSKKEDLVNGRKINPADDEAMPIDDETMKIEGAAGSKQQTDEAQEENDDDDDDDEEFPDIVAGGPDSDDEE